MVRSTPPLFDHGSDNRGVDLTMYRVRSAERDLGTGQDRAEGKRGARFSRSAVYPSTTSGPRKVNIS